MVKEVVRKVIVEGKIPFGSLIYLIQIPLLLTHDKKFKKKSKKGLKISKF